MPKKPAAHKANKESHSKQYRARKPSPGEKPGKGRGSGNKIQGIKIADPVKSKDGCFPKASMLFLPFVAVGIYFLFRA